MRRSKYNARQVTLDGHTFQSVHESERWQELRTMEWAGLISDLQRQVPFQLLPSQRGEDGKVLERGVKYIADFVYIQDGKQVVEDAKGVKTDAYKIKRKLMLKVHGIRVQEV